MPLFFFILLGGLFRTFFPTRRTRSVARLCRAVGGGPVLLLLLAVALPIPAAGATADSFRTEEYRSSTGLDFLRAADAYALGFTGAGVTLGIIDSAVRADHPELAGKVRGMVLPLDESTGQTYVPNWADDDHGSHVAGIMAAARDGRGMHGVAFDANLFSVAILGGSGGRTRDFRRRPLRPCLPRVRRFASSTTVGAVVNIPPSTARIPLTMLTNCSGIIPTPRCVS